MNSVTTLLIIASMSSGNSAQAWLEKGAEAFAKMRMADAARDFEKAVEADPYSAKAQLSLGVIYLFQYQNGVAESPDETDDVSSAFRSLTRTELLAQAEKRRAQIAEQNATNAARAEEHLKQALQLQPRYEPAMEYLAALYLWWRDPSTQLWARRDDARQWYARVAENNAQHGFAYYACAVIDYEKAFVVISSTSGFPRPLTDEESRRSLRVKVGPLLEDAAANFLRSLELDPDNSDAMTYLGFVKSQQAYIAETRDDSAKLTADAAEWHRKVVQIKAAQAKATGQPWPRIDRATITFHRIPGKAPIPPFPPDAGFMIPPAPPPPPAAFRR